MKTKIKNNIRKYIRKYIPVLCTLLLIPCISFNAFAYTSYDNFPYNNDVLTVYIGSNYYTQTKNANNQYQFSNPGVNSTMISITSLYDDVWNIPVNIDVFDYYVVASVFAPDTGDINFTFFPSRFRVGYNGHSSDVLYDYDVTDVNFYHTDNDGYKGFSASCKVDLSPSSAIGFVRFDAPSSLYVPSNLIVEMSVIALPKGLTSGDANQAIVNAINSQTSELSSAIGSVDDSIQQGNDLIENGTDDTQSAITDFNEVFEDFNEELENWEQFDDAIIGEFNYANDNYMAELDNFSLSGSLLNAGNWLSTSMQTVYDNSSDYKMLWLVPLLFGIPILLFIIRKNGDDE